MKKEEFMNALDDLLMDAWEYRDHLIKVAKNESWNVIHDAPKGLISLSVNMALRTCDRFTFRINDTLEMVKIGYFVESEYEVILKEFEEYLLGNIDRYNKVLEQIGSHTIVLTHRARFRKSYVRS